MAKVKIDIKDITHYVGREIGLSRWMEITQSRVTKFAEATGDFQWIHVDAEQARTTLPSGQTIVHNLLLVSLIPQFFDQIVEFSGLRYGLNRGADNVSFLEPLPTGSKVRIRLSLLKLEYVEQRGLTGIFHIVMDRKGHDKPVLTMTLRVLFVAVTPLGHPSGLGPVLSDQHQPVAL